MPQRTFLFHLYHTYWGSFDYDVQQVRRVFLDGFKISMGFWNIFLKIYPRRGVMKVHDTPEKMSKMREFIDFCAP